jgi:D-tyrosyl-tRNA(Tyr) deacylase
LAAKVGQLRVFGDQTGKMNRSLADVGGEVLAVPNFTLYGDCQRGRRPDFSEAAEAAAARGLFGAFCRGLERQRIVVRQGAFGAHMQLEILNDGPVTLLLDTDEIQR